MNLGDRFQEKNYTEDKVLSEMQRIELKIRIELLRKMKERLEKKGYKKRDSGD